MNKNIQNNSKGLNRNTCILTKFQISSHLQNHYKKKNIKIFRTFFTCYKKRLQKKIGWNRYIYIKKWVKKKNKYIYKTKLVYRYKIAKDASKLNKRFALRRIFYKILRKRRKEKNYKFFSFFEYIYYEYSSIYRLRRAMTRWKKRGIWIKLVHWKRKFKWPQWPRWKKVKYMIPTIQWNYLRRRWYFFSPMKNNNFRRHFFSPKKIIYQQQKNILNHIILIKPIIIKLNITINDYEYFLPTRLEIITNSLEEFIIYLYLNYFNNSSLNKKQINFIHQSTKGASTFLQPKLLNLIIKYKNILKSFYPDWSELSLKKTTTEEARLKFMRRIFRIVGFRWLPKLDKKTRNPRKPWRFPDSWIRRRQIIFKLKILFDRLFLWLYRHKNAAYLFHFIRKRVFKFHPHSYQIIYKKNIKLKFIK